MPAADKYSSLEFDRLLAQVANYAGSELTRELIRGVEVVFHPARIAENLDQTGEALRFTFEHPAIPLPPFSSIEDMLPLWEAVCAGELVDNQQARALRRFFDVCDAFGALLRHLPLEEYPRLADVASAWQPQEQLASLTRRIFNDEGDVRDNASPALNRIRERLRRFEGDVRRDASTLIKRIHEHTGEDALLTIRSNRFVVLMPRSMATEFQGTIVDMSSSGQSIYFEPQGISPLNAERQHLFLEEDQELRRIISEYGRRLAGQIQELRANLSILVRFDYIFARARHAAALSAQRPRMVEHGGFVLNAARHPLLYRDFVPEDLIFDGERALIISGVNAGGKTVLLKLLGIYSLMATLGCYVPGDAQLPYLSGVFADIGDDQSTLSNLSTFTAHLQFVMQLWQALDDLEPADPPLLVLIDEIGTGTEPGEGAAFAHGLITALLDHNTKLAVTTHYDVLKTLGFERADVKNVCLEFDQEQLKPTYRVLDGLPGQSYALQIAARWGIAPEVLTSAQSVLGQEERRMAGILGELEAQRLAALDSSKALRAQEAELARIRSENEQLSTELKESKLRFAKQAERMKQELEQRIDQLLTETKQKLKSKARQATRHQEEYVKAASQQSQIARDQKEEASEVVEELLSELSITLAGITEEPVGTELAVGAQVQVEDTPVRGKVLELHLAKGEAVLDVHGKRMSVKLARLRQASASQAVVDPLQAYRRKLSESTPPATVKLETSFMEKSQDSADTLDLHGQRVEEAQESLDEFISKCLLSGLNTIRIMHGIGTGRLKQFVWEYLRRHAHVHNIRRAGLHDGGIGVTLADLK